jgi:hypothetical protein
MSAESAAMAQWADNNQGTWTPEAWHKSPATMQAEASAANHAIHDSLMGPSNRHDNPPCVPTHQRLL